MRDGGRQMSADDQDRGRLIALAISEGINSLANLRKVANAHGSPPPECLAELDDMERAFQGVREGIREGKVESDLVVDDSLMADVRGVRGLVADWLDTGKCPSNLVSQIEGLVVRRGLPIAYLDSVS